MKLPAITALAVGFVTTSAMTTAPAATLDDIAYIWQTDSGDGLTSVLNGSDVSEHRGNGGSHWAGLGDVRGIVALDNGDYAVAEYGGTLRVRSGVDGGNAYSTSGLGSLVAVTQLPGNGHIITVSDSGMIRARNLNDLSHADSHNRSEPWTDVIAQTGSTFVTASPDGNGRVTVFDYDADTQSISFGRTQNALGGSGDALVDVLSDGRIVFARDGQLRIRGADPTEGGISLSNQGDVRALAITPDDRIVIGNTSGNLRIHSGDLSSVLDTVTLTGESIQHVAVQSTGDIVVASIVNSTGYGRIRVLDGTDLSTQLTGRTIYTTGGEWRGLAVLVPEPGSMGLLGLGAVALLVRHRR